MTEVSVGKAVFYPNKDTIYYYIKNKHLNLFLHLFAINNFDYEEEWWLINFIGILEIIASFTHVFIHIFLKNQNLNILSHVAIIMFIALNVRIINEHLFLY